MSQPSTALDVFANLPKQEIGSEYISILKESIPLEEKLTAIYSKAISNINDFSFCYEPAPPHGYFEAYAEYKSASIKEKSDVWRGILEVFKGYFKELDRVRAENKSNKLFLEEMKAHFEKVGLIQYSEKIILKLQEFEEGNL